MLRQLLKTMLRPAQMFARRAVLLPSLEEQNFASVRGSLYTACQFAVRNAVAGDYLEFGVWRGDSFTKVYHALTKARREHIDWLARRPAGTATAAEAATHALWERTAPRFIAFDSFAGLPAADEGELPAEWVEGAYACSEPDFRRNLAAAGVDLKDVITVPGFYDKTLTPETKRRLSLTRAAIVHVDCDLYESTKVVLDFVADLLTEGSILIFDDWFYNQNRRDRGEQRAFYEWCEQQPQLELVPYWQDVAAKSFIVNFRPDARRDAHAG